MTGPAAPEAWPDDPHERLVKLAHDLRSPLVVVKGFAELLTARPDLAPGQQAEFLARIAAGAQELQDVLDAERASRPLDRP